MARKFVTTKRIDKSVQPWMQDDEAIEEGIVVYAYSGCTYGCVGDGIAVTMRPDETPFIEVPRDAVKPL